jgi:hypothetical protein
MRKPPATFWLLPEPSERNPLSSIIPPPKLPIPMDQLDRDRNLYREGIFENPLESLVHGSLHDYFANEFARAWWAETKWKFDAKFVEIIETQMKNISVTQDMDYMERIKARLSK